LFIVMLFTALVLERRERRREALYASSGGRESLSAPWMNG